MAPVVGIYNVGGIDSRHDGRAEAGPYDDGDGRDQSGPYDGQYSWNIHEETYGYKPGH